ncbi:MAG: hypothetical protein GY835_12485 [bacterium]|nr:hypothetical protein [bacterium]
MANRAEMIRKAVGLTAVAAVLRLFRLGDWSLWIDEGNTLWLTEFLSGKRPTDSYPVFFWLERGMVELLGTGEFALRLLPALLGIISVPLLYLLFRRDAGERTAFWGAMLMALCPWHLFWSQNARYYTLLLVEAILLFKLAWSWWEDGGEIKLGGIVAVGFLGVMSQYTLLLAWPALGLYPIVAWCAGYARDRRFAIKRILIFWVALAIPVALAFGRMLKFSERFIDIPQQYGNNPLLILAALVYRLGLPICIAILLGLIFGWSAKDRTRRRFTMFLTCAVVIPSLLAAVMSLKMIATSYYVFFALPLFLLLAGQALAESFEHKRLTLVAGLVLAAFYLQGDILYFTCHHGDRIRWREAVALVNADKEPGDKVISSGAEAVAYYLGAEPQLLNGTPLQESVQWRIEPRWLTPAGRTWYIINNLVFEELDHDGAFTRFIRERCVVQREFPCWVAGKNRSVRVYLYEPR